jgi:hypothetical protein
MNSYSQAFLAEVVLKLERPSLPQRVRYRVGQFLRGMLADVQPAEMLAAAQVLPKPALARFCRLPLDAQRHSLNVLYTLQEAGYDDPDLMAAALLHDVGKLATVEAGIPLRLWLRSALVLLEAVAPDKISSWAREEPAAGWRYVLHVHRCHARIGAGWAADDGCSARTCWLIAHHQDRLPSRPHGWNETLLALLQWADSRN